MNVRTGVQAGDDGAQDAGSIGASVSKWMTCWRCQGKKDEVGNVSQATCGACWPMGAQSPV